MAAAPSLNLAVYVVGFNGQYSSKNYVGCGKSCVCRQFMYNDYSEEPCSTLLQAEFDGCVINRQHTIYWGQKEVMYTSEKEKDHMVTFDVFEHTLLYQDGTSIPYNVEKYEKRIFTPLRAFLNKYSFKSREEILYPEEYAAKKFTYTMQLPVAYLYVVDVSQSCPVFVEQLHVMETLINFIKKSRHHCVILASKFDSYCKENVKQLESCASKLKVDVIQSSSKYNTNIDTTFKYLAVKSLQLKKKHITVNVLSHAESAVEKRTRKIKCNVIHDEVNIDEVPHISMATQLRNSSMFSPGDYDYPPDAIATNRKSFVSAYYDDSDDSFDSGGDDSCDSKVKNTLYGSTRSSIASVDKERQPLVMKRSLSFSGQDTAPIQPFPHSTGTLPKLPKKTTTYVPEIGQSIYISRPTPTRASKPLPKLPFESVGNGDRQLGHKNKNRKHLQRNNESLPTSTEDYVNTEHSEDSLYKNMQDEDSDSSDPYKKIDFGYRDEESEETSPSSFLPNGTSTAVNGTIVTNNASIDLSQNVLNKPVSPTTADTAEQEGSAVVPSGSAVMLPSPKAAEGDSDIKYKTEEDVNGIDSKVTEYSTSLVPVDSKKNEPLTISSEHNSAQNSDHTIPNDDAIPSEPTYDDTVVWKFQKRNSGNYLSKLKHNSSLSQSKLCANNSVTVSSHVPVTKKPLQHQMSSSYVKMYRVAPSIPDDNDQLSDTESEVYSYDYLYHKDLMLRKSGRDCNGTPPRNIQRSNYNPSLADYVNISTQQDYVNFKVIESHSMVCPPRACSTKNGTGAAQVKPKPKQRANYRPLYPARDNPRPGYFLSGPLAKPS